MLRRTATIAARVQGVAWNPPPSTLRSQFSSKQDRNGQFDGTGNDYDTRQHLNKIMAETEFLSSGSATPQRKLVKLPGVPFKSDLPADPITRLFFQQQGEYALYQGSYTNPEEKDSDRIQIERRDQNGLDGKIKQHVPMYDFCHRIREASEQRKRFVIVPSTAETKGCAQVMMNHGIIAGFRDFHNDRAFAIELKYFQSEPTITVIAPCSVDGKIEFEWSPKMMRRLMNSHGIHNKLQVYICRAADGRVMDHIQATREQIGGRGLMMVS